MSDTGAGRNVEGGKIGDALSAIDLVVISNRHRMPRTRSDTGLQLHSIFVRIDADWQQLDNRLFFFSLSSALPAASFVSLAILPLVRAPRVGGFPGCM